ncbi:hypothetical protein [Rhizobium mesoamericanum]|uniref:hypothetical protein n=1 Tax=Rhizobium mesoamericanum TaxID=1079800 RepID=UPI0002EFB285|nr:hypothetical protein [Rhizobium mesoamericanum]
MTFNPTRRQVLAGGATITTTVALGGIHPAFANADRTKITVRVEKDLSNLDPATFAGPYDHPRQCPRSRAPPQGCIFC